MALAVDPAAYRPQPLREGPDFWSTPPCLCAALVRHVLPVLPEGPVWECAAGSGALAVAMAAAGRRVVTSDLRPLLAGDEPVDFLRSGSMLRAAWGGAVVTNPPFNLFDAFLGRGLALLDGGALSALVLLARLDHLQASGRAAALNRAAWEVHCNWRPVWIDDGRGIGPRWSFHWLVWGQGMRRRAPLYLTREDVA